MHKRFSILGLIWGLLILGMTLTPGKDIPNWELFSFDKLGHFGLFGILSFLIALSFTQDGKTRNFKKAIFVYSVIGSSCYGIIIELIQSQIPGRSASLGDVLADVIGALLGFWVFHLTYKFIIANKEK